MIGQVRCDTCSWHSPEDIRINEYLGCKCPKCGAQLLNRTDHIIVRLFDLGERLGVLHPPGTNGIHIHVDTDRRKHRAR